MDPVASVLAWRIGTFKFGVPTLAVAIALVILVVFLIFILVRSRRRGLSK